MLPLTATCDVHLTNITILQEEKKNRFRLENKYQLQYFAHMQMQTYHTHTQHATHTIEKRDYLFIFSLVCCVLVSIFCFHIHNSHIHRYEFSGAKASWRICQIESISSLVCVCGELSRINHSECGQKFAYNKPFLVHRASIDELTLVVMKHLRPTQHTTKCMW